MCPFQFNHSLPTGGRPEMCTVQVEYQFFFFCHPLVQSISRLSVFPGQQRWHDNEWTIHPRLANDTSPVSLKHHGVPGTYQKKKKNIKCKLNVNGMTYQSIPGSYRLHGHLKSRLLTHFWLLTTLGWPLAFYIALHFPILFFNWKRNHICFPNASNSRM